MTFDTARYLGKATSRAKSDVANKLVGMFLHELSRNVSVRLGTRVSDTSYTQMVAKTFGTSCVYCERHLESDRASVEHLDGMNRFRVGLHVAGNVVVSCKRCNNEKRRDDARPVLSLADSGWESFLAHNGLRCETPCKTCEYWESVWPDRNERIQKMGAAVKHLATFRAKFPESVLWSARAHADLKLTLEAIYRSGQEFAEMTIKEAVVRALEKIEKLKAQA